MQEYKLTVEELKLSIVKKVFDNILTFIEEICGNSDMNFINHNILFEYVLTSLDSSQDTPIDSLIWTTGDIPNTHYMGVSFSKWTRDLYLTFDEQNNFWKDFLENTILEEQDEKEECKLSQLMKAARAQKNKIINKEELIKRNYEIDFMRKIINAKNVRQRQYAIITAQEINNIEWIKKLKEDEIKEKEQEQERDKQFRENIENIEKIEKEQEEIKEHKRHKQFWENKKNKNNMENMENIENIERKENKQEEARNLIKERTINIMIERKKELEKRIERNIEKGIDKLFKERHKKYIKEKKVPFGYNPVKKNKKK